MQNNIQQSSSAKQKSHTQKQPPILIPLPEETDDPNEQRIICEKRLVQYRNNLPPEFITRIVGVWKTLQGCLRTSSPHSIDILTVIRTIELFAYLDVSHILSPSHTNNINYHPNKKHLCWIHPRESIFRLHTIQQNTPLSINDEPSPAATTAVTTVHELPWTDCGIKLMFVIAHWILDDHPDFELMDGGSYVTGQNLHDIQYLMSLFQWYIPSIGIIEWISIVDHAATPSTYKHQIKQILDSLTQTDIAASMSSFTPAQLFRRICCTVESTSLQQCK